MKQVW